MGRMATTFAAISMSLALLAAFGSAVANAKQVLAHTYASSFTGATSTAGPFGSKIASIDVNEETGDVYTITREFIVSKFDESGNPKPFTAPALSGASSFETNPGFQAFAQSEIHLTVDNSHTATQGRIYVAYGNYPNEIIQAFNADGSPVGGKFPLHPAGVRSVAVDPTTGDFWTGVQRSFQSERYTPDGTDTFDKIPLTPLEPDGYFNVANGGWIVGIDSDRNFYLGIQYDSFEGNEIGGIEKYDSSKNRLYNLRAPYGPGKQYQEFRVDPVSNDLYVLSNSQSVIQYNQSGDRYLEFGNHELTDAYGFAVNGTNGKVYIARGGETEKVDIYNPGPTVTVPSVSLAGFGEITPTSVKMLATVDPEGQPTTSCHFDFSKNYSYSNSLPCAEGVVQSGSGDRLVSATAMGVQQGTTYHYRVVVSNSNGTVEPASGTFVPSDVPHLGGTWATDVHSDSVRLNAEISPEGVPTTYRFQYGAADCSANPCSESDLGQAGKGLVQIPLGTVVTGLAPGTTYHYRVITVNQAGTIYGPDRTFTTYPFTEIPPDPCTNAHVRQQVSAALLPECRAYELVSAADTGGYSVESDIVAGQHPFGGYPDAAGRVLYGVHSGAIPGPWVATNHGVDPYVATRGADGWSTNYVGIPANNPYAAGPFSSALDEANSFLTVFAFGGGGICAPCFEDGSTGIPLHEDDGGFVQGMQGPADPAPTATSDGLVRKRFSADGKHLIFGSTSKFAEGGNNGTGDVSIYDRNLERNDTQVVSNDTAGNPLACLQGAGNCHSPGDGAGIAELDVSKDGSRIVVGQLMSTDARGVRFFHLYMHVGQDPETIDLTPGTTTGVQYDGMTEDGSSVFFTTTDPLATATDQDSDTSADIFRADVSGSSSTLIRVSTGSSGTGNSDSCAPSGEPDNWNVPLGEEGKCGALAFAGGSGVASQSGAFYFLSPEKLDDSNPNRQPLQDQANLYFSKPGSATRFVETIDSTEGKSPPLPPEHPRLKTNFVGAVEGAETMAVDQSNGDLYVTISGSGEVRRFDSSGAPRNFTSGPAAGTNALTGLSMSGGSSEAEVAVDNSAGALNQDVYVTESSAGRIAIFAPDGTQLGAIDGSTNDSGGFSEACGVAVDASNGSLYVGDYGGRIWRYVPNSPSGEINDADYTVSGINVGNDISPCNIAADNGLVYASGWSDGPLERYSASSFAAGAPPVAAGTKFSEASLALATDPASHYVYVNEGEQISVFDPSGSVVERFASGEFFESRGIAVRSSDKHVFAIRNGNRVVEFGYAIPPYVPIDNTAVVHARTQPETHSYGDFQVTSDGNYAAFGTVRPLTGHDNNGYYEVFRYDTQNDHLACASCNPTGSRAQGDSSLAAAGLSLMPNGTVFFNSDDAIAPRDLDGRQDVYEWTGSGTPDLISTGGSPFDSSLLGASADGTDAFFFTRDTLVPQDKNGTLVKIYDARKGGGFEFLPTPERCKASDECHGAGSEPPGALPIATGAGDGGAHKAPKTKKPCPKGKKRHKSRCTKPKHHHKRKKRGA
jgi:hypothetical protein